MISISVVNEKGGLGKSTITYSLATCFSERGYKVLMIDLDGQKANLSYMAGIEKEDGLVTMFDVLVKKTNAKEGLLEIRDNLHIIPADISVTGITKENVTLNRMKMALNEVRGYYDLCFIDLPPSPGMAHILTVNTVDYIIIPMEADAMSLTANLGMIGTIKAAQNTKNPNLEVLGILLNKYNWRTNLSKQVTKTAEKMAADIGTKVFKTKIRNNVSIPASVTEHIGITLYDKNSNGAKDFEKLTDEIERMVFDGK